jgi:hypothetical protein
MSGVNYFSQSFFLTKVFCIYTNEYRLTLLLINWFILLGLWPHKIRFHPRSNSRGCQGRSLQPGVPLAMAVVDPNAKLSRLTTRVAHDEAHSVWSAGMARRAAFWLELESRRKHRMKISIFPSIGYCVDAVLSGNPQATCVKLTVKRGRRKIPPGINTDNEILNFIIHNL